MVDKYTYHRKKKLSRKRLGSSLQLTSVDAELQNHLVDKPKNRHVSGDVMGTAEVKTAAVTCEKIGLKKCQTERSGKAASLQPVGKLKSSLPGDHSAAKNSSGKVTMVSRTVRCMSVYMMYILVVAYAFVLNSEFVN